jgi:hypothetical protein
MAKRDTALDFLKAVYCNNDLPLPTRLRAAIASLNFQHPRLQVTAQVTGEGFAELLDRRLERMKAIEEGKVIEHQPQEPKAIVDVRHVPRVFDRRWRRL